MKFCPKCGNKLDGATKFCPNCGTSIEQKITPSPPTKPKKQKKKKSWLKRLLIVLSILSLIGILLLGGYFIYTEKNSQTTTETTTSTSKKKESVVYESELANNERLLAASIAYYANETLNWDLWQDLSKVTMIPIDEKAPSESDAYKYCYQDDNYYYVIEKEGKISAVQLYKNDQLEKEIPFSDLVHLFTSTSILKDIQTKAEAIHLEEK